MSGDDTARGEASWAALLRVHARLVRTLEAEVERGTGLALSWYDVLLELDRVDGGQLRMQELAGRVVLSRSRISRVVDEMARAGMVAKDADPDDGRATLARITDRGREALRAAAPTYLAGIERHFGAHLADRELTAITKGLTEVLQAHAEEPCTCGDAPR